VVCDTLAPIGRRSAPVTAALPELTPFQSAPQEKYKSFLYWLRNEAPDYYEEGGEDAGFAQPDAVQIMTVHQASCESRVTVLACDRRGHLEGAGSLT